MTRDDLLLLIETFLAETGMGPSYFGRLATGNSKLVKRLREGKPVHLETVEKVVSFIRTRRPGPQSFAADNTRSAGSDSTGADVLSQPTPAIPSEEAA